LPTKRQPGPFSFSLSLLETHICNRTGFRFAYVRTYVSVLWREIFRKKTWKRAKRSDKKYRR
jgi:hypothetical protein